MSTVSVWFGIAGFVLCLLMIGFGIFAPRPRNVFGVHKTRRSILCQGALMFLAVWLWLSLALPLLAWGLWIGDNQHWFYKSSSYIAATIALAFVGFVVYRIGTQRASLRYIRVQFWCSVTLLAIIASIWSYELIKPIEGVNPKAAAKSIQRRRVGFYGKLVENQQPDIDSYDKGRCITYWVMGQDEPKGRITVCRYGWFWWSYAGSVGFPPSDKELQRAKERLQDPTNRDTAPLILKEIVRNYPGTKSAKEAQELLNTLQLQLGERSGK